MEFPDEAKNRLKRIVPIQIDRVKSTGVVVLCHAQRSGGRSTTIPRARPGSTRQGPRSQTQSQRARLRRAVTVRSRAVTPRATTLPRQDAQWGEEALHYLFCWHPKTQTKKTRMHEPNGKSEQGKKTDPWHASYPSGTSPH